MMIGPVFGFQTGQLLSQVADRVVMIGHGSGYGSGLIWGPGLVVTNHHVAERGNPVVIDRTGIETRGRVVAVDKENDLAAISVPWSRTGLGSTADSERLQIGQIVLSMGHPLGNPYEGSIGIVSGIESSSWMGSMRRKLLQLDLRLRPGNSGGPIVGEDGRLVGVACMVASPGIGLAIPSNIVEEFVRQLKFGRRAA
jgi:S1-C subfamily serine protease